MSRVFEYKGPSEIKSCADCLYLQVSSNEELYCQHPDSKQVYGWLSDPVDIPQWCPLPEDKK